jgi:hypothetical protein
MSTNILLMVTNILVATHISHTNIVAVPISYTHTAITTNWLPTGNTARTDGTNYIEEYISDVSVVEYLESVTPKLVYITNQTPVRVHRDLFSRTNTVIRMTPVLPPPLPNAPSKL